MEFNIHAYNAMQLLEECVSMRSICEIETKGAFGLGENIYTVHNMQCITHAVLWSTVGFQSDMCLSFYRMAVRS